MTAQLNTVAKFALADCYIAPENVRAATAHDADGLKLLANSVRHFGRLLEPLKAYIDDEGRAAVWDGGRRFSALQLIAEEGDGVGRVITDAIDVLVTSKEDAAAASLATFVREDQHPADQFLAYNAKFDEGMTASQIAAAFAVEARTVSQLLRFRTLSPEVLEAFRAGRFGLDVAYAFTLTTDHDKQRALLDATGDREFNADSIKKALTQGAVTARHQWARFIGREAYEAAGGTFIQDLFSHHNADEQWSDGNLVNSLAQQKLNAMEAEFLAEGWSKMIVPQNSYGWQEGYEAMKPEGPAPKKGKPLTFTAEQKAQGVVFVVFDYSGDHEVKKGFRKVGKKANPLAPQPLAKQDPAKYGFGHKGHHTLTSVATEATRVGLMRNPVAAMDALAGQMAWATLRKPPYTSLEDHLASRFIPDRRNGRPADVTVAGHDEFKAALDAWSDRLPKQPVAFFDAVAALPAQDKQALMALCFAASLDADEDKIDGYAMKPARWTHLGWMARHAGVDVGAAWVPTPEFVAGGSKEALLGVIEAVGNTSPGAGAKKADLADIVVHNAEQSLWRPALLEGLTDVADPEPEAPRATMADIEAELDADFGHDED